MVPEPDAPPGSNASSSAFWRHVSRVTNRSDDLLPFVLVPVLTTLLNRENVRRAFDQRGRSVSVNVEFAFPTPLLDLWRLVDPPEPSTGPANAPPGGSPFDGTSSTFDDRTAPGGSGGAGGTEFTIETPIETLELPLGSVDAATGAWLVLLLVGYAAVSAAIAAGYLGGIDRRLRGEPASILACLERYGPRFFLYNLVVFGAFLALLPVAVIAPPLVLLAFPVVLLLGYLFYAAPFLLVVDDAPVLEAFRRSYRLAVRGGPYLGFALRHVVVAAGSSLALSLLVSAGVTGALVAFALSAPLALVLTAATVSFLREYAGDDGRESDGRPRSSRSAT